MPAGKYIASAEKRSFMFLPDMGDAYFRDRWVAVVTFKPHGAPVEAVKTFGQYEKEGTAKAQASREAARYQYFFERQGERFEVLQKAKLESQREKARIERVKRNIVTEFGKLDPDDQDEVVKALGLARPD